MKKLINFILFVLVGSICLVSGVFGVTSIKVEQSTNYSNTDTIQFNITSYEHKQEYVNMLRFVRVGGSGPTQTNSWGPNAFTAQDESARNLCRYFYEDSYPNAIIDIYSYSSYNSDYCEAYSMNSDFSITEISTSCDNYPFMENAICSITGDYPVQTNHFYTLLENSSSTTFNDGDMINFARNDGTTNNGVIIEDGAMSFDGVDDYVDLGNSSVFQIEDNITTSIYFKLDSLDSNQVLIAKYPSTAQYFMISAEKYGLKLYTKNSSGTAGTLHLGSISDISIDTWYNLIVAINESNGVFAYLNNKKLTTYGSVYFDDSMSQTGNLEIGRRTPFNDLFFNGSISDVTIYNRSLSREEITEIYNAGRNAYTPIGQGLKAQYSGRDFEGPANAPTKIIDTNMITQNNNSKALKLNGINQSVEFNSNFTIDNQFTISTFVYRLSDSGGYERIITKGDQTIGDYDIFFQITNTDRFQLGFEGRSDSQDRYVYSNSYIPVGQWTHLLGVFDGDNFKLYVNGELDKIGYDSSSSPSGLLVQNSNTKWQLGRLRSGGSWIYNFEGLLYNTMIYNESLTDTEIQALISGKEVRNGLVWEQGYIDVANNKVKDRVKEICLNCFSSELDLTMFDGAYKIYFTASNNEMSTAENYTYFTIDTKNPTFNDTTPALIQNATFNISTYINYTEDYISSCYYNLSGTLYNCTDNVNITSFDTYNYEMVITDLAGNSNTTNGSFLFDILASIYINDEDFNLSVSNSELNITGTNFSDYSYSNPYQEWISNLGSQINYSYIDSSGETIDKEGSINFSTTQTNYYIYVENTPFKMYFYDVSNSTRSTNFLTLGSEGNIEYNESSVQAVHIQKDFATGLVRVIFNWNSTSVYEQQYQYINDLTQNINENVLILPNMNAVGFFKVTDIYGVALDDVTIKLQARHINETTPLLTTNQILTDSEGNGLMYYELGNGYKYWISINKDNYVAQQFQIDLDNIENGNSATPYTIRLKKIGTTMNNGLSAYFNTEYNNESSQIPMYFYTTKYSVVKFKTQYMIDRGIDWITIPENSNLDNVYAYTLTQFIDYSGSGEDITLYVQADSQNFTYTISYNGDTKEIFSDLRNTDNEYLPFIIFIALIMIIVGVRYQFKNDSMSVPIYFIGIILMSLITQTALYGFIPLMLIGIYYLSKSFKKVGENTE